MKGRFVSGLNALIRFFGYRLRIFLLAAVATTGVAFNYLVLHLTLTLRLALATVFVAFASGMILSVTQFFTQMAFNAFELLNWKYKVEKKIDSDVNMIAEKIGSPNPKSINITDNPNIGAATNAWTGVITISRRMWGRASTGDTMESRNTSRT